MIHSLGSIRLIACCILLCATASWAQQLSETLPEPPNCGLQLGDRIFGGEQTTIDEHPWTALLSYNSTDMGLKFLCVGNLINARWVITAAHCVSALTENWRLSGVRLGEWNLSSSIDCAGINDCAPPHIDLSIDSIFIHPGYTLRHPELGSDIALMRLERSVATTTFVKPVCLMKSSTLQDNELIGMRSTILGWGPSRDINDGSLIKVKASLNILPNIECDMALERYRVRTHPSQMCAGGGPGINTCDGDAGGPMLVKHNDGRFTAYYMVGITSIETAGCSLSRSPTIFTRISLFFDWIQETIAENGHAKYTW